MKTCQECGKEKPLSEFHKNSRMKDGRLNRCAKCRRFRCEPNNPETKKNTALMAKYGISLNQYREMFKQQSGVCAICKNPETRKLNSGKIKSLSVDHCHETGKVRGLLCTDCNSGIGYFKESPWRLKCAAGYCFFGGYDGLPQEI